MSSVASTIMKQAQLALATVFTRHGLSIVSMTWNSSNVTMTLSDNLDVYPGTTIIITGADNTNYNGTFTVLTTDIPGSAGVITFFILNNPGAYVSGAAVTNRSLIGLQDVIEAQSNFFSRVS